MLMDIFSEMIHGLLPMFLVGVLGVSVFTVGIIEELPEATAFIVKMYFWSTAPEIQWRVNVVRIENRWAG